MEYKCVRSFHVLLHKNKKNQNQESKIKKHTVSQKQLFLTAKYQIYS